MPAPQGVAHFPGLTGGIVSASYTLSHGITPGVALLTIVPQRDFPVLVGPLTFTFGNVRLIFNDMKVDKHSFRYDDAGYVWQISLLDRRWKWRFGEISGRWNVREADQAGEILPDTEATPVNIAINLFDRMGDPDFDALMMPTLPRPEIDYQIENPAKALADLAEQFGYRVVLDLGGTARLLPAGIGAALPAGSLMAGGATIDPPERPDKLAVYCGPTLYQIDVQLEAVGEDRAGEILPLDELSYMPLGGWQKLWPLGPSAFATVGDTTKIHDPDRELARRTVYRMYRITKKATYKNADGTFRMWLKVPTMGDAFLIFPVETVRQLLPLDDRQAEHEGWVGVDGTLRFTRKPALIWGTFYFGGTRDNSALNTTVPEEGRVVPNAGEKYNHYNKSFSIDKERGIVTFSEPVFYYDVTDPLNKLVLPAKLGLRTACVVSDPPSKGPDSLAPYRYTFPYTFPAPLLGTPVRPLKHDELVLRVFPEYSPGNGDPVEGVQFTNREDIEPDALHYLEAAKAEYQQTYPDERTYMGLVPISPDGAIQQVTWSVGPQGATTMASRNTEHALWVPSYRERRFLELLHGGRIRDMEETAKRLRRMEWFRRLGSV